MAEGIKKRKPQARSAKQRENQIINMVMDVVEQKILDGSASSQILCHFLKLATERERLENERLKSDMELSKAKIRQIDMQENLVELYEGAIAAMNSYRSDDDYEGDLQ